jgi:hypothetical protein
MSRELVQVPSQTSTPAGPTHQEALQDEPESRGCSTRAAGMGTVTKRQQKEVKGTSRTNRERKDPEKQMELIKQIKVRSAAVPG